MAKTTRAVAKKESGVLAENTFKDFLKSTGYTGKENISQRSLSPPFLKIAHTLSPQLKKTKDSFIAGLKAGDFFNTVTGTVYGDSLKIVVLGYFEGFVEWLPERGGFVGSLTVQEFEEIRESLIEDAGSFTRKNGNEIKDTRNYFVFLPDFPDEGIILFPMSGSGVSASRKWQSKISTVHAPGFANTPIFSCVWELTTAEFSNDKGDWYQVSKTENTGFVWDDKKIAQAVLDGVKTVKELVNKAANIDYSKSEESGISDEGDF